MKEYKFYKEESGNWYIDLPEWEGSKADLEMVAGADTMLDYMAEGTKEVITFIEREPFDGSDLLQFISKAEDIGSGAYYEFETYKGEIINLKMWICDVITYVFGDFPEKLYICKK